MLVLQVAAPFLRFVYVVGHAPRFGRNEHEVIQWWRNLWDQIPLYLQESPFVLALDANTTVGHDIDDHIGGHQAGRHESRSEPFVEFVHKCSVFLPATFEDLRHGAGETWAHTSGSKRRIDFIGLPRSWTMLHCDSWVLDDFGAAIITTDHSATCAEWSFEGTGHAHLGRRQARQLDFCNLDFSKIQASLQPLVDLGQDPHSCCRASTSCGKCSSTSSSLKRSTTGQEDHFPIKLGLSTEETTMSKTTG